MRNTQKALEAIERLVGDSFGMDMEWYLHTKEKMNKTQLKKNLRHAAKIITEIYKIAHADTMHACSHQDWEGIKYKILKANP